MRKVFLIIAAVLAIAVTASCSCENGEQFGVVYSLRSNGSADGDFNLTFMNGEFGIDGQSSYHFKWSNDTTATAFQSAKLMTLSEALESTDPKVQESAVRVNNWVDESIKVTEFSGHYDIYVKGYVMETLTQFKFSIDRHFTNIPEE